MSKILVRELGHAGRGTGRPGPAIVAIRGASLKVFRFRVRRAELETLAAQISAEAVYLPRGGQAEGPQGEGSRGRHHRRWERDEQYPAPSPPRDPRRRA